MEKKVRIRDVNPFKTAGATEMLQRGSSDQAWAVHCRSRGGFHSSTKVTVTQAQGAESSGQEAFPNL